MAGDREVTPSSSITSGSWRS
ncbi:unnamed protein product [Callosobruchus maculatus]|uniref:Uncharacterized protein n=1 Tax=Callosobruchus maculatus TaxID=64391 RepID=A0A653BTU9_CALMS|nr:unnamed protein product [Callosobruchus maculatus]